jgi:hypothetical protein
MSLINDALKKVQHQRTEHAPGGPGSAGGGSMPGGSRGVKSIAVLAGGALTLVLVSVGLTIYLVSRRSPATSRPSAVIAPPAVVSVPTVAKSTPPVAPPSTAIETKAAVMPATTDGQKTDDVARRSAVVGPGISPASTNASAKPAETIMASAAAKLATTPAALPPVPVTAPAASPNPAPNPLADERVHQYLDNLKITGVKAAGNDSRVLMNEKVFRLNEIVDRTLSLRLIRVEADNLTFSDINGVTYTKFF